MDRIAKALDISRRSGSRHRLERPGKALNISYTQTRTVPVARKVMKRSRLLPAFHEEFLVDAYRLLRTRVLKRMAQNGWNTIGVTSAGAREGKSLTAINLGMSMALERRHTVLLVDTDLRRPAAHHYFGLRPEYGLVDYLSSDIPVEKILIHPGIERFVLFPGKIGSREASEHLCSDRMEALIAELKGRYPDRIIIFDLPPVLVGDDVVGMAPMLDAMLLVVEEGKTQSEQLATALHLLEGAEILGTVLNKSEETMSTYDYYY